MADDAKGPMHLHPPREHGVRRGAVFTRSLSARLLGLTVLFVILSEVLLFGPSLSAFQRMWLQDRVNAAQIAALALEASPDATVTANLRKDLLENAEVSRVALKRDGQRELRLAEARRFEGPIRTIDLRDRSIWPGFYAGLQTLLDPADGQVRVLAKPRFETGEFIEVVIAEAPLKREMADYSGRVLRMTLVMSLITASLLYLACNLVFVRPMQRLTNQIEQFRDRPEDATAALVPSSRADEIGRAERALADMESQVRNALRQRERLASLGAAVAKLAHDLRNSLSTASLVTERLAQSDDPRVSQSAPRLERAIARAAGLAEAALRYGRADEPAPHVEPLALGEALDEAADDALAAHPQIAWRNAVPDALRVQGDGEYLHRIFTNLMRNAAQAMTAEGRRAGSIEARVARGGEDQVVIELADDGPGLNEAARARLFEPFSAASARGGAGLGLSIARELARRLGGDLNLAASGPNGATFAVTLRTAPAMAPARA
ncbi:MAG TPA: HAMP domain-containing sensor histidine kinase, partial [Caulobacterales bacterium]|nr:HAMP domain-containing sensor histidine kinase [Caulobacterales bacterium]